jgi:hypothetical protein
MFAVTSLHNPPLKHQTATEKERPASIVSRPKDVGTAGFAIATTICI